MVLRIARAGTASKSDEFSRTLRGRIGCGKLGEKCRTGWCAEFSFKSADEDLKPGVFENLCGCRSRNGHYSVRAGKRSKSYRERQDFDRFRLQGKQCRTRAENVSYGVVCADFMEVDVVALMHGLFGFLDSVEYPFCKRFCFF